jgi:hypothetical protein
VAAAVLAAPACGHRGDPLPPLRRTPPAPGEFRLAQRGEALELRAIAPTASVDGVVYERVTLEFLVADGLLDLEKRGRRREVAVAPGSRVAETLPLPSPGTTVRAAARAVAGRERGPRSLTQALVVRAPLEAPRELTAALAEDGVALAWRGARPREPAAAETAPDGARGGFLVYRRTGGAEYAGPLPEEPLDRRNHRDTTAPPGLLACYVVRAVASTDPLVESGPSNEACVTVRDIAAPAAPTGLAVLPRDTGLELLWGPGTEPDLGGYRVYRRAPGGERGMVAELPPGRASWLDEAAEPGVAYLYEVTAFDAAGNESPPTEPAEGRR